MGASLDIQSGFGFVTASPEEEDFGDIFTAAGIDPNEYDANWEGIELLGEKYPHLEFHSFGHYDYCWGYLIVGKSTHAYHFDAVVEVDDDTFKRPTLEEVAELSAVLGLFYPNFDKSLGPVLVASYG